MHTIEFDGESYPAFQAAGFASRFAFAFAKELLSGKGYDIGCGKPEWSFPGSIPVDLSIDDEWDAMCLPEGEVDYIFSSHCLEHLSDWVGALDYWTTRLGSGGILFLYLPHYSQKYWRPWSNRKHVNILSPELLKDYFEARGWINVFVSGPDLNNSFCAVGERP